MRKLLALSLGLTLMTGCDPSLLKSLLSAPGGQTTGQQPSQQPGGQPPQTQPSGAPPTAQPGPSGQPGQFPPPPPPPGDRHFPDDCVAAYKALDTDGDGFVSNAEWKAAGKSEADFTTTDRNMDGRIDLIDFCDKPMAPPPPPPSPSSSPSAEPTATPEASASPAADENTN